MSCHDRRWIQVACALLVCTAVGGCGLGSGSTGQGGRQAPHVAISLTAPMTGATVGVSQIRVTGKVTPANATVRVAGLPATVRGAAFARALALHGSTTTIPVTAAASGWAPTTVSVTVHYSRRLAVALTAARAATWAVASAAPAGSTPTQSAESGLGAGFVPTVSLGVGVGAGGGGGGAGAGAAGGHSRGTGAPAKGAAHAGAPGSGASTGGTPTGGTPSSGTPTGGTPTGGTPSSGTPSSGTPTGGAPSGGAAPTPPAGSAPPAATLPQPPTPAEIEQAFIHGCELAAHGGSVVAYCGCVGGHLAQAGLLRSLKAVQALARSLAKASRATSTRKLPRKILRALFDAQVSCASKLPTGPLGVSPLPVLHHAAAAPHPGR